MSEFSRSLLWGNRGASLPTVRRAALLLLFVLPLGTLFEGRGGQWGWREDGAVRTWLAQGDIGEKGNAIPLRSHCLGKMEASLRVGRARGSSERSLVEKRRSAGEADEGGCRRPGSAAPPRFQGARRGRSLSSWRAT